MGYGGLLIIENYLNTFKLNIMKVIALNYQRNGISGEPFMSELLNGVEGAKGTFIATFETNGEDTLINQNTCRVVKIDSPYDAWRGDSIAWDIQTEFKKTGLKKFYDWVTQFRESTKGTMYYKKPSERTKAETTS